MIYNPEEFNWQNFCKRPENRNLTTEQLRQRFMIEQSFYVTPPPPPTGESTVSGIGYQHPGITPFNEILLEDNTLLTTEQNQRITG